ncbi:flagellar protein FliT [Bacillus sp. es.034]|uniref:flagellar protein FliT n=1 Tax=Bacillus sp. es.034 TaxID=1761763 RepID=UPI000BF69DEA|nr:flagellar protein FliT [Bacillus sp. es.034]PFG04674.1 flagellar protein FliT [Bacillus sp. es.034]
MSSVEQCYELTKQLYVLVGSSSKVEDRLIEEVDQLILQREGILSSIQPPYTEAEQTLGRQIVQWNTVIDKKLAILRDEVKKEMNSMNKKKITAKKYSNPYEHMQTDGYFYDQKK